eukprot:1553301-Amphidinium_carterae.1
MPAPKPEKNDEDATRVPVSDEGSRTWNPAVTEAESQQTVQSSSARHHFSLFFQFNMCQFKDR